MTEVTVVGSIVKPQSATVVQGVLEDGGKVGTQFIQWRVHFLVHNASILLFLRVAAQSLPRESALQEVYKDVAERLQIVSATLLNPEMICNAGVAWSPGEVLVFTVPTDEEEERRLRSVGLLIRVHVTFAQSEVD